MLFLLFLEDSSDDYIQLVMWLCKLKTFLFNALFYSLKLQYDFAHFKERR